MHQRVNVSGGLAARTFDLVLYCMWPIRSLLYRNVMPTRLPVPEEGGVISFDGYYKPKSSYASIVFQTFATFTSRFTRATCQPRNIFASISFSSLLVVAVISCTDTRRICTDCRAVS
jgi:hypothetical protein